MQRIGDGLPLRVEDRRLQGDEHTSSHNWLSALSLRYQLGSNGFRARAATQPRPNTRSKMCIHVPELLVQVERLLDVRRRQHARDVRVGQQQRLKSRCSWNERIALRCTHSYACSREMPRRASSSSTVPENTTPRDRSRFSRMRSG